MKIPSSTRILNYVWINDKPAQPDTPDAPLCCVPFHYFDHALENAHYTRTSVIIWIDYTQLDPLSSYFVDSYRSVFSKRKIYLKDLRDLTSYRRLDNQKRTIWNRVDLARLLALRYCFNKSSSPYIFYADFDIKKTKLKSKRVKRTIREHGMVFGGESDGIENSYMGFDRTRGQRFLNKFLIPQTLALKPDESGYGAVLTALDACSALYRAQDYKMLIANTSPSPGSTIPLNQNYLTHGLNLPIARYPTAHA